MVYCSRYRIERYSRTAAGWPYKKKPRKLWRAIIAKTRMPAHANLRSASNIPDYLTENVGHIRLG